MVKKIIIGFCICILFLNIGCITTGARSFSLKGLKYPASMSAYHLDSDRKILSKNKELKVISKLNIEKPFYSILYGSVDLSDEKRIEMVSSINKKIEDVKGDGMLNVYFTAERCGILKYPAISLLLAPLPFIPGCVNVQIQGEIVQLQ